MKVKLVRGLSYSLVVATKTNPIVDVSEEDAQYLIDTGYFEAVDSESPSISADILTVIDTSDTVLGKSAGDLIDGVVVHENGDVTGTIKYVKEYKDFSSNAEEQSGNYFPFKLTKSGSKVTIKKNGTETRKDVDFPDDNTFVFRVANSDKFEVIVDSESVVTLNFSSATIQGTEYIMSLKELKAAAASKGIDITGLSKKEDIAARLANS